MKIAPRNEELVAPLDDTSCSWHSESSSETPYKRSWTEHFALSASHWWKCSTIEVYVIYCPPKFLVYIPNVCQKTHFTLANVHDIFIFFSDSSKSQGILFAARFSLFSRSVCKLKLMY